MNVGEDVVVVVAATTLGGVDVVVLSRASVEGVGIDVVVVKEGGSSSKASEGSGSEGEDGAEGRHCEGLKRMWVELKLR